MEDRNLRPEEYSKLPMVALGVLIAVIAALLFIGYEYFSDGPTADIKRITEEQSAIAQTEEKVNKPTESEAIATAEKPKKEAINEVPTPTTTKKVAEIPSGGLTIPHVVAAGETFFGIANRYNLKSDVLKALNPELEAQALSVGTKLKIKIKAKHTIGPGDILSVVAKKYDTSKEAIMAANKLEKDFAKRGDELLIPFGK
jgi:LysM repeat protein